MAQAQHDAAQPEWEDYDPDDDSGDYWDDEDSYSYEDWLADEGDAAYVRMKEDFD